MKAVQYSAFSQDLNDAKIVTVSKPEASAGYAVVKVMAAAGNPIDYMVMKGYLKDFWPMEYPFTMGYDFAGVVESVVDEDASKPFSIGDEVFAVNWGEYKHDTQGQPIGGAFAEYIKIPISKLSKKPSGISFADAAAIALVGTTAYQMVNDYAKITSGMKVLILGGPTSVGVLAIQLAKANGAYVATTTSTRNLDTVKKLNPDRIINYREEKWEDAADVKGYDVVLDIVGEEDALSKSRTNGTLKEDGCFITITNAAIGFDPTAYPPLRFGAMICLSNNPAHQDKLASMLADGSLQQSIGTEYPFTNEGVQAMLNSIENKTAQGKCILKIN